MIACLAWLLAHMPTCLSTYVLMYWRVLCACMPICQCALYVHVLTCKRTLRAQVLKCQRASRLDLFRQSRAVFRKVKNVWVKKTWKIYNVIGIEVITRFFCLAFLFSPVLMQRHLYFLHTF